MGAALLALMTIYFAISLLISWAILVSYRKRIDDLEKDVSNIKISFLNYLSKEGCKGE